MSNNNLYTYGNLAYKRSQLDYAQDAPVAKPKPRIDVVPGGRSREAANPSHSLAFTIAKYMAIAICVFALIGFTRITLAAATVAEALEEREITSLLEDVRSSISQLEVTQSSLSNPTRIKAEAAARGMAPATDVGVLDIKADIVAVDANGALSLTASIDAKAAEEAAVQASNPVPGR